MCTRNMCTCCCYYLCILLYRYLSLSFCCLLCLNYCLVTHKCLSSSSLSSSVVVIKYVYYYVLQLFNPLPANTYYCIVSIVLCPSSSFRLRLRYRHPSIQPSSSSFRSCSRFCSRYRYRYRYRPRHCQHCRRR